MKPEHMPPAPREEDKGQPHLPENKHSGSQEHSAGNALPTINQPKPTPSGDERAKKNDDSEGSETKRFQRRYLTTQWLLVAITFLYSLFSLAQWYESGRAVTAMNRANELADQNSMASAKREAVANQRVDRSSRESARRADASLAESRRLNTLTANMVAESRRQAETSRQQSASEAAASLKLARQSLEESRRSLEISQRARLGLTGASDYPVSVGTQASVVVEVKNAGHMPAANLMVSIMSTGREAKEAVPTPVDPPGGVLSRAILLPGDSQAIPIAIRALNAEQVNAIKDGTFFMYLVGRATYDDGFGHRRQTLFCLYHQPQSAGWNICAEGNTAD